MPTDIDKINEHVRKESAFVEKIISSMSNVIVGQKNLHSSNKLTF
jgi:hypothetical protein